MALTLQQLRKKQARDLNERMGRRPVKDEALKDKVMRFVWDHIDPTSSVTEAVKITDALVASILETWE